MWNYLAQTDVTVRALVTGAGPISVFLLLVIVLLGFVLVRSFFTQMQRPIAQRTSQALLFPFIALLVAMVVELGALFTIVGLPFSFTVVVSVPLTVLTGYLIWQQFLYRALSQLPGPKD
ncbi:hypothetical protein [Candidatus Cyanaurora vandensis]|uniref:hypothetical protein n=1 Tax=Candidatus Cyanaurora vandensis TaxID=2714958 RepID=UPI00257AC17B|nr:hypothetical protein [Candidatus Cyanaurora vandensis]